MRCAKGIRACMHVQPLLIQIVKKIRIIKWLYCATAKQGPSRKTLTSRLHPYLDISTTCVSTDCLTKTTNRIHEVNPQFNTLNISQHICNFPFPLVSVVDARFQEAFEHSKSHQGALARYKQVNQKTPSLADRIWMVRQYSRIHELQESTCPHVLGLG